MNRLQKLTSQLNVNHCAAGSDKSVTYEVLDGGIALVTLNRPNRMNGLTKAALVEYFDALDAARDDNEVKVIVVTGAGRAFSAGADLDVLDNIGSDNSAITERGGRNLAQRQATLIPKPIIAAINGPVAGLGLALALMADIRFAIKDAKFATAFAKRGLIAEYGISFTLPRIVGVSNAMDLLLSSRAILGNEAKDMGLVQKLFDTKEELMAETLKYAREMAALCSPASLAAIKRQVYDDLEKDIHQTEIASIRLMKASFKHPDSREGVQSYMAKRSPVFQGLKFGAIHDLVDDN